MIWTVGLPIDAPVHTYHQHTSAVRNSWSHDHQKYCANTIILSICHDFASRLWSLTVYLKKKLC